MVIRKERECDYNEVYELVKTSFATCARHSGEGTETADYLNEVRKKSAFIPELSLVAESDDEKIIGQIVLYETPIITKSGIVTQLLLSPICVHPDYFRQGIARSMVEAAFAKAKEMGYKAVFLCGNPELYHRLGFAPTYKFKIYHVKDNTAEWSMVRELYDNALIGTAGTVNTN
ncbi:MAG: N-acetyltransferase [Clostridiales bacterium]|jgi:predicted N-acetyltransferase YhbS|nr:N-acetyltransferase [Clostridiales bacterium]